MTTTNGETRTRPRVICHMMASVDGRIVVDGWPISDEGRREYERVHNEYDADGWICGRVTMEPFAEGVRPDSEVDYEHTGGPRDDFRAPGDFESFAFAVDAGGKLLWRSNDISGDHVVAVLSNRVSDEYLAFLRQHGVSYVLAGAREVDLPLALEKIGRIFGVKTLLLEGGGRINGGFLRDGLIDEVSLLLAPVTDGRAGIPALFDIDGDDVTSHRLALEHVERGTDDFVWLRYRVEADPSASNR